MPFLTESPPPRGIATEIRPGIRRIVADNPSVMTYLGTNTYLLDNADGLTIIDPGPDHPAHIQDILAAAGNVPIRRILLTHGHGDHAGAASGLQAATGAPVFVYRAAQVPPETGLADGDTVAGLNAVFTPGHAADHLCFATTAGTTKILFSGDHVMSWSSSIVNPPDGNMRDYYRSLDLLLRRDDALYLPGHGPPLPRPRTLVEELLAHRRHRETAIIEALRQQEWSVGSLAAALYGKTDPWLIVAAQRNVLAHFLKLRDEGLAVERPGAAASSDATDVQAAMRRDAERVFALPPEPQANF